MGTNSSGRSWIIYIATYNRATSRLAPINKPHTNMLGAEGIHVDVDVFITREGAIFGS